MCRIGDRLPVGINAGDISILETKTNSLPEEGFDQSAVFPVEDFSSQDLNTLKGRVWVTADIFFQELGGCQQEGFNFLERLFLYQLYQATVDFPKTFLMDKIKA